MLPEDLRTLAETMVSLNAELYFKINLNFTLYDLTRELNELSRTGFNRYFVDSACFVRGKKVARFSAGHGSGHEGIPESEGRFES